MLEKFLIMHFGIFLLLFFHLLFRATPIVSLFFFLFFIICVGIFIISMQLSYLGFVLISVYGGAIVVLFLLVSMLFNKKQTIDR